MEGIYDSINGRERRHIWIGTTRRLIPFGAPKNPTINSFMTCACSRRARHHDPYQGSYGRWFFRFRRVVTVTTCCYLVIHSSDGHDQFHSSSALQHLDLPTTLGLIERRGDSYRIIEDRVHSPSELQKVHGSVSLSYLYSVKAGTRLTLANKFLCQRC